MKSFKKYIWLCLFFAVLCISVNASKSVMHTTQPLAQNYITAEKSVGWLWPVPSSRTITSLFGYRNIALYGFERMHTGIDIHAATDVDVLAPQSGTVLVSTFDNGWGHYIIINHGDNILSLYAHLNTRTVKRGESVERGQVIGKIGNTGFSEGPHLHFEIRENGKPINPFRFTYEDK